MLTYLEIVLWGRGFQSSLSGYQQFNSHKSAVVAWQSQSPFRNQQRLFDPEETIRLCQLIRVCRRGQKLLEDHEFFGAFPSMKLLQTIISEEGNVNQCHSIINKDQCRQSPRKSSRVAKKKKPMPQRCPLSVDLYLYPLQTSHVLLSILSSKPPYALFLGIEREMQRMKLCNRHFSKSEQHG